MLKKNRSVAKKYFDGATKFYFLQPNENLGCNIATSENSQIHTLSVLTREKAGNLQCAGSRQV